MTLTGFGASGGGAGLSEIVVVRSGTQETFTAGDAGLKKRTLDIVPVDPNNNWDITNQAYVAPTDGRYLFIAQDHIEDPLTQDDEVRYQVSKTDFTGELDHDIVLNAGFTGNVGAGVSISGTIQLTAGDALATHYSVMNATANVTVTGSGDLNQVFFAKVL